MSGDDKDLKEAKRIMAKMLNPPPKPHKAKQTAGQTKAQKPLAFKPKH